MHWGVFGRTRWVNQLPLVSAPSVGNPRFGWSDAAGLGHPVPWLAGIHQSEKVNHRRAVRLCLYLRIFDDLQMGRYINNLERIYIT